MDYDEFVALVARISPQLFVANSPQPNVMRVKIDQTSNALFDLGEDALDEAEIRARLHQAATDGIDQLKKFRESLAK